VVGVLVEVPVMLSLVALRCRTRTLPRSMRVLGRWMRMITIPNQSSVAKAFRSSTRPAA
jgi:hypothetical protein